jgi:hypothetical protein
MSPARRPCEECRRLTLEVENAIREARAIQNDIDRRIHANLSVSAGKVQRAKDAETAGRTAVAALQVHTKTHVEISK